MDSEHSNHTRTQQATVKRFSEQDMYFFAIPALAVLILGPVSMATRQRDPTASRLGPLLTKTVQDLRSAEELVHQVILPQLRQRLASLELPQSNGRCVLDYPYTPETNGGRLADDIETLAKLFPRLKSATAFESNRSGFTRVLLLTAVSKLQRVVSDYQAIRLAEEHSTAVEKTASAFILVRNLPQGTKDQPATAPPPQAPPTPCSPLVTSALQQYETLLQVYIALVYATRDAVAVNNYYNSQ